jgi:uncharacterized membrane protein
MDRSALGMGFGEFWSERAFTHTLLWLVAAFIALWATLHGGVAPLRGQFLASGLLALVAVVLSCLTFIPVLAVQPLAWLTIYLEARWRIRHNRPCAAPPPLPHRLPPPDVPKVMIVEKKRGGWLLPLAIGLWIGGTWGGDD